MRGHIDRLDYTQRDMWILVQRLRAIGDALTGARPEPATEKRADAGPSLLAQLDDNIDQIRTAVTLLESEISRLESIFQIGPDSPSTGINAGGNAYANR